MAELTLHVERHFDSPWVFHAFVALREKGLPFGERVVTLGAENKQPEYRDPALIGKVPVLVDGPLWISESLAISEYLAERYRFPDHPRLFPADLGERAR